MKVWNESKSVKDASVSVLLLCYNQEEFVKEALESTLLPMKDDKVKEIIISDDCSNDKTYNAISGCCRRYGINCLVRRNSNRLGVVRHLDLLVKMASGQLIVLAAGDDIAAPNKVSRIVEEWKRTGSNLLACNPELIDGHGKVIGRFSPKSRWPSCWQDVVRKGNANVFITAFTKAFYLRWGGLPHWLPMEDQTLVFRALLEGPGGLHVIDEPLVQYRVHGTSMSAGFRFASQEDVRTTLLRKVRNRRLVHESWIQDLSRCGLPVIPPEERGRYQKLLERRIGCCQLIEAALLDQESGQGLRPSFSCRLAALFVRAFPALSGRIMGALARLKHDVGL